MLISRFILGAALLAPCVMVGCNGTVVPDATPVQVSSPADLIKSGLEEIVKTGEVTSGIEEIRMNSGKLSDPAKVAALQKGLDDLSGLKGPDKIKAKAKELLGGL